MLKTWVDNGKTFAKRTDLKEWDKNPRGIDKQRFNELCDSLEEFGQFKPVLALTDGTILGGNMRLKAFAKIGIDDIWVSILPTDNPQEAFKIALRDNERFGYYNEQELAELTLEFNLEPLELKTYQLDLGRTRPLSSLLEDFGPDQHGSLNDTFGVPPFSILDTRQGYWQDRAREWDGLMGDVSATREGTLGMTSMANEKYGKEGFASGVSELDPVMCELMYKWFTPGEGAKIFNPFGGEPVSAFVAAYQGYQYYGTELRQEQIDETLKKVKGMESAVHMACGDAVLCKELMGKEAPFDLLFSSPPFYDLEIYSKDPADLSAMGTYEEFMYNYTEAFKQAASMLADNRFCVINVTEIRDKPGAYRNFVGDNVKLFTDLGLNYYNDIILVNAIGTGAIRAARNMASRKVVRVHQNLLVFYKGDVKTIKDHFPKLEIDVDQTAAQANG